jgi:hypothetical protein
LCGILIIEASLKTAARGCMKVYAYFIGTITIMVAIGVVICLFQRNMEVNKPMADSQKFTQSSVDALQPPIQSDNKAFKGKFEQEFDKTINVLKAIKESSESDK